MSRHRAKTTWVAALAGGLVVALTLVIAFLQAKPGEDLYSWTMGKADVTLLVDTDRDNLVDASPGGNLWAFPLGFADTLRDVPTEDGCATYTWSHANGGQDFGKTTFAFTIKAHEKDVLVDRFEVESTRVPSKAVDIVGCGMGDLAIGRWLIVDLATESAKLETFADPDIVDDTKGAHQVQPFGLAIGPGKSERVVVDAFAEAGQDGQAFDYSWRLKLRILIGDEHRTLVVDNKGQPFVTVDGGPGSRSRLSRPWE